MTMSRKVVINACFGGFGLSPKATLWLWENGAPVQVTPVDKYFSHQGDDDSVLGKKQRLTRWREWLAGDQKTWSGFLNVFTPNESCVLYADKIPRDDPKLIGCIEKFGEAANGACAKLKIVEIPDDVEWQIAEYDGNEHVEEVHRTWY